MNNLYSRLKKTFSKTFNLLVKLKENRNRKLVSNFSKVKTNPLIWEFMNIIFYWNKYCLKQLKLIKKNINDFNYNERRKKMEKKYFLNYDCLETIQKNYHIILNLLIDLLFQKEISLFDEKVILNSLVHNDIVNERIIFTFFILNIKIRKISSKNNSNYLNEIIYINIPSGDFKQGNSEDFCFDNEYPEHLVSVKKFSVSKYCITNNQYLKFVSNNGYNNNKFWDPEGWIYIKDKKMVSPLYWKNIEDEWFETSFGETMKLRLNNPVTNISYYEAKAFCRFNNCRLPTESEWEYLANNFKDDVIKDSNLDDNVKTTISVLNDRNVNNFGVVGLFGNVWEWCNDKFYPYDGFKMDVIDRERSYIDFGNKINCRGGSFCTSSGILTKSYRGCENPTNISKFIGFRVVKF